jgi:hypothetical protein
LLTHQGAEVGDVRIKMGSQYWLMLCVGLGPEFRELVERDESIGERLWLLSWRCAVEVDHRRFAA